MTKVSVMVLTYNHANYIRQTLDSIVTQKTNFPFEILVGDDASTDSTAEIIREYHARYPDLIVPILHKENLGGYGKNNTLDALSKAKGQYIAPMDGDDYWIDDDRLQKLVDFLDKNTDFVACFHNAEVIFEDGTHPNEFVNPPDQKEITTVEDFIGEVEVWFIATSAIVFRHGIIKEYPQWFHESKSGDIPRYILLGKNGGKFKYINETLSVYRRHRNGGMSFTDKYHDAEFLWNRIGMYQGIDKELNYQFHETINKNISRYYKMLMDCRQYKRGYWRRAKAALQYLRLSKINGQERTETIRDYILPKWLAKIYSFFALLPHRVRN
jgi:glycosyltransferase involved in cell wall biosynthesis